MQNWFTAPAAQGTMWGRTACGAALLRAIPRLATIGLLIVAGLSVPAAAQAQFKRLSAFETYGGNFYHRWSDDGGVSWSIYNQVPPTITNTSSTWRFVGFPAAVSDRPGRLNLIAKTTNGYLTYTSYNTSTNKWNGWWVVPGTVQNGICGDHCYSWNADSMPAVTSWGPGRLEVFINATRDDGGIALLHTWADNSVWSGLWEVLGTGWMQSSPAAVSWGPGRTDVFVRGGGGELAHKWFTGGRWSRGWESLGGVITSSPSVASPGPNRLNVFGRGTDGHLWSISYDSAWAPVWGDLGGSIGAGSSPTSTSKAPHYLDVYVYAANGFTQLKTTFSDFTGWTGFINAWNFSTDGVITAWVP